MGRNVTEYRLPPKVSLLSRSDRATPHTRKPPQKSLNFFLNLLLGPPTTDITKYINKARESIHLCACIRDWIGTEFAFCVQSHKFIRKERCVEKIPEKETWFISEDSDGWPLEIGKRRDNFHLD